MGVITGLWERKSLVISAISRRWWGSGYRKFAKYSDTQNICCNHSKIWTMWLYHRVMSPNNADGMANSVDPDQTAPLGAVWSGSALFAQTCLSENLGSLRYKWLNHWCTNHEINWPNLALFGAKVGHHSQWQTVSAFPNSHLKILMNSNTESSK